MDNNSASKSSGAAGILYVLAFVLALAVIGAGVYAVAHQEGWAMLAAGSVALVGVLVAFPLTKAVDSICSSQAATHTAALRAFEQRLAETSGLLKKISEQQLISDRAKAVAYREKDREALRRAIGEEINKKDWEAALVLANEIEAQFGYRGEAEQLRTEINKNRDEVVRKRITEAAQSIDGHTRGERWTAALREADQLIREFPDVEQVRRLPQDIEARRQAHKKQLVESWNEAVARKDIDGSIEILKKLDTYLTPTEAESMQETARGVFKEKLKHLHAEFSHAVQEHNWAEAIKIGDVVMRDYPNSRMALEIKDTMEALRQRAGSHEVARV